jgi:hypothetical protein
MSSNLFKNRGAVSAIRRIVVLIVGLILLHSFAASGYSQVGIASIAPVVTETGRISLSIDGLGTLSDSGIIQVEKPAGATVRSAYLAAVTTGFFNHQLVDGDVQIDGVDINWDQETPSSIQSWNYWADVTSLVKPKIDAAPAGRVDFTIVEAGTLVIDGEILAVIFDDPNQTVDHTVILLFGAQSVAGDTFVVGLTDPIDTGDPNLILDMSLGISFGAQEGASQQFSEVDVNGQRLTSSAGGADDGSSDPTLLNNGALLTVGGLDDSNNNPPDPFALPADDPRIDDELYSLIPFVSDGDTIITTETRNPSTDDNIFFAAFYVSNTAVIVTNSVTIVKDALPNASDDFTFTASDPGIGSFALDDDNDPGLPNSIAFFNLPAGSYTFTETVTPGWRLTEINCSNGLLLVDPDPPAVTIDLVAGQDIICTFSNGQELTAIELISFTAEADPLGVSLTWETASEIDNEGFNIWRSETPQDSYIKLNADLIPAQGNADTGASYVYLDPAVSPGVTYYYRLEDIDIHGVSTFHDQVVSIYVSAQPKLIYLPIILTRVR